VTGKGLETLRPKGWWKYGFSPAKRQLGKYSRAKRIGKDGKSHPASSSLRFSEGRYASKSCFSVCSKSARGCEHTMVARDRYHSNMRLADRIDRNVAC
jgi:hypothetical protein